MLVHEFHVHVGIFGAARYKHRHPVDTGVALERCASHRTFLSVFVAIVILQHPEIGQLVQELVKRSIVRRVMLLGIPLVKLSVSMMFAHFEEVAGKHIEEQIQRGLAGHGVHLILEDASQSPILGGVSSHLDLSRDAVGDVSDEFQEFQVRVFVAFVLGDKLG